ncbi:hypothetical protein CO613_02030 [Lysobacteraceae bacterium NML07-0707]|nr:hypothetical protein CO613_02030 [Xanthomonadaceae bacterium NML07-0707]
MNADSDDIDDIASFHIEPDMVTVSASPESAKVIRTLVNEAQCYRLLLESVNLGIVIHAADGQLLYINPEAIQIHNPPDDGDDWQAPLDSNDWLVVDGNGKRLSLEEFPAIRALREGRPLQRQTLGIFRVKDRHFRWLEVTAIPHFNEGQSKPAQVLSILRDITDERRDRSLWERLQTLADTGVWEWNRSNGQFYFSPGTLRLLALETAPKSLSACMRLFPAHETQRIACTIEQALNRQESFVLEVQRCNPDGEEQWLRLRGEPDLVDPFASRISGTLENISHEKRVETHLRHQVRTDPLTGLLNRDAIITELEAKLDSDAAELAVLYIDLDRFKQVNDTFGHGFGDQLLQQSAKRLLSAADGHARCARLGGDEFLLLCPGNDEARLVDLAEQVLAEMAALFQIEGQCISISASIGIARAPQDGHEAFLLMQHADTAMYESKRRGSNRWLYYHPEFERRRRQQQRLQADMPIRRAIDNGEISLRYLPQLCAHGSQLLGLEVQLQWQHPENGEVSPGLFLPHVQRSGEIIPLGNWALRQVCLQIRRWRDAGLTPPPVGIDICCHQLAQYRLSEVVGEALAEAGIPGQNLIFEIDEQSLLKQDAMSIAHIDQLRAMGTGFAIDNFGAQHAALNCLQKIPARQLKFSPRWLQNALRSPADAALCRVTLELARTLGLHSVALGVNEAQLLACAQQLPFTQLQGRQLSMPLNAPTLAAQWLQPNGARG